MRHLIRNISIFDGTATALVRGTVSVNGDRIESVTRGDAAVTARSGDVVIDGRGGTLMPGLVEAHAHLTWPSSIEKMYHQFVLPPDEMKVATWRNARVLLDSG